MCHKLVFVSLEDLATSRLHSLLSGSLALDALWLVCTARCALQEALYKYIDTIQYNRQAFGDWRQTLSDPSSTHLCGWTFPCNLSFCSILQQSTGPMRSHDYICSWMALFAASLSLWSCRWAVLAFPFMQGSNDSL